MKYFIKRRDSMLLSQGDLDPGVVHEVTPKRALAMYRAAIGSKKVANVGSMENLLVQPAYRKGEKHQWGFYEVWGENISKREVFKRRLNGEVAKDILIHDSERKRNEH